MEEDEVQEQIQNITNEEEEILRRFICVFFINETPETLNKEYKKVKVVECKQSSEVVQFLKDNHSATYIKSIRDLDHDKYYIYNHEVNEKEQENNDKLYRYEKKKKKTI